ncbi:MULTISPECIES: 4-oxalocrotonate tautomerase DmpI [Sporomusa]|jgi:4-oxalocrotonate tautomerase|uniref:Tautomerase n=1 Tax=uncultured Sporomusa sp. TaxID=307249 RepID=A0A212LYI8_9FIRM|nr:4-oxalocrotonate tautomerase DmpI [Sporomusa sphaeroides]SCM82459.1 conserved hypothetical protein [uncultured Sporomusa sp.]HML33919.1 2-hydroxymuconate tautomerase family protein [Sporomusa sphaeroides]
MPVITIEGPQLSIEQKRELVQAVTESASNVMKMPKHSIIVMIKEIDRENVGVGGLLLSDKK